MNGQNHESDDVNSSGWSKLDPRQSCLWTGIGGQDRGQVVTIDFMFSMIIRVAAIGIVLAASATLMYSGVGTSYSDEFAAKNGAALLADDVLLEEPGDSILDSTCTEGFFDQDTTVCGHHGEWTSGESPYLNEVFGLNETTQLNVAIWNPSGKISSIDGTELALGEVIPDSGNVYSWRRSVALDTNGDGNVEWHTLRVRAW